MAVNVLPIKGLKSLAALRAFNVLLLGFKMLPAYLSISFEEFYESFQDKTDIEKEKILREAVLFVELDPHEVESIITFVTDPNGVPYSKANIKNLKTDELFEIIVAVCMEIGRIKISILTEEEKKKSLTGV